MHCWCVFLSSILKLFIYLPIWGSIWWATGIWNAHSLVCREGLCNTLEVRLSAWVPVRLMFALTCTKWLIEYACRYATKNISKWCWMWILNWHVSLSGCFHCCLQNEDSKMSDWHPHNHMIMYPAVLFYILCFFSAYCYGGFGLVCWNAETCCGFHIGFYSLSVSIMYSIM